MAELSSEVIQALRRFRNVIVEGPPGTGKTYVAQEIGPLWTAATGRPVAGDAQGAWAITFHPSTSYEDFVEGLRYEPAIPGFDRKDGFITRVVNEAKKKPEADFLVLLDEVNRANVPKVLGDLLLTLEPSKRQHWDGTDWTGGVTVTLPYSGRVFGVPDNIYVLGTMNTSDRSIAPLDAALRRRFAFVRVTPLRGDEFRAALRTARGEDVLKLAEESIDVLDRLNDEVLRPVLGPDGELGHSYLFDLRETEVDSELRTVFTRAATGIRKVFWTEVRGANGGSGNQFDLIETGVGGHGSVELFYPLLTDSGATKPAPVRTEAHDFTLRLAGKSYVGNTLRVNEGNSNFRLYLKGQAAEGSKLSELASKTVPVPHESSARALEHRIHIWLERDDGSLELALVPNTPARRDVLTQISEWTDRSKGGSAREFGLVDMAELANVMKSSDEPRLTWRYAILPQLVELAVANGVEDLFDPTRRSSWQAAHGFPAGSMSLDGFDDFLAGMNIWLRVVGHDLGRTLMILDEVPPPPAPPAQSPAPDVPPESPADNEAAEAVQGESEEAQE
jgi:MoxR-like ATPase